MFNMCLNVFIGRQILFGPPLTVYLSSSFPKDCQTICLLDFGGCLRTIEKTLGCANKRWPVNNNFGTSITGRFIRGGHLIEV